MVKGVFCNTLVHSFLERFSHDLNEQKEEDEDVVECREEVVKNTLKKFVPPNTTACFSVMRSKIEKAVDDGYTFKVPVESERPTPEQLWEQRMGAKSPVEQVFEDRKAIIEKREREYLMRTRQFVSAPKANQANSKKPKMPFHKRNGSSLLKSYGEASGSAGA